MKTDLRTRLKLTMLWLRAWWNGADMNSYSAEAELERIAIQEIRGHFAFFGFDISDLSDGEFKERMSQVGRVYAQSGLTSQQAIEAVSRLQSLADSMSASCISAAELAAKARE